MSYSTSDVWFIIAIMGIGTFLIRFSFLGLIGDRSMPPFVLRLLRFTPVAVLPAMIAPLALFPDATGGTPEPVRLVSIVVVTLVGWWRRSALWGLTAGAVAFYAGLIATGQL